MSGRTNRRVLLRVHKSWLRRARVNLHSFAPPSRGVLQVARAATKTGIARPSHVPTLWRHEVVDPDNEALEADSSEATSSNELARGEMSSLERASDNSVDSSSCTLSALASGAFEPWSSTVGEP